MFRIKPTKQELLASLAVIAFGVIVIVAGFALNGLIPKFAGYIVFAGIILVLLGIFILDPDITVFLPPFK